MIDFAEIRADLAAFADDDEDVLVDERGQCLLVRGGEDISFQLERDGEDRLIAVLEGRRMLYRDFVGRELGRLDILAERILAKRQPVPAFVDCRADLRTPAGEVRAERALDLLHAESDGSSSFSSRVTFITADAGQGKTALLRQFQHDQARRFVDGLSRFVFWHVDLQGRQLLRLQEALAGDLSDLRVSGLWMPAVIRLLRHRVLVLAIDGFDELAAEQGSGDALGALAVLVEQMDSAGTIVAASRRTFFDTDDYVSRAKLIARPAGSDCEFDQISLYPWGREEALEYLRRVSVDEHGFDSPEAVYEEMLAELHGDVQHTMLTRPFLLTYVARALLRFNIPAAAFIRGMDADDPYKGVGEVIEAFVDREVSEKWKQKETGEPYLTKEQHLRLLADVAEEMMRAERSSLDVEVIETITSILLEEWNIEQMRRQQVLEMVRMHVLLRPPVDGSSRLRSFDHEEFLAWFTAYALKDRLERLSDAGSHVSHELLSVAQISDATARYVSALVDRTPERVARILSGLEPIVSSEWRPTYLQLNVGTLAAALIDGIEPAEEFVLPPGLVFSSVVLEDTRFSHVRFRDSTFVHASLARVTWNDVTLSTCRLGELTIDRAADYAGVVLENCALEGLRIVSADGDELREYAPHRMRRALAELGIEIATYEESAEDEPAPLAGETRRLVKRVLMVFRRTTIISDATLQKRFPRDSKRILDDILPLMVRHGVLGERQWKGAGKHRAWGPEARIEDVEKADGDPSSSFYGLWQAVDDADLARR